MVLMVMMVMMMVQIVSAHDISATDHVFGVVLFRSKYHATIVKVITAHVCSVYPDAKLMSGLPVVLRVLASAPLSKFLPTLLVSEFGA